MIRVARGFAGAAAIALVVLAPRAQAAHAAGDGTPSPYAEPPWVAEVRVEVLGAEAGTFDAERLRDAWRSLVGRRADAARLAEVADEILGECAASGRLDAICRLRLVPAGADSARLLVALDEGRAVPLGAVAIDGALAVSDREARRLLGLDAGAAFDPARFVSGTEDLLARYEERGYPFARIAPRDFRADSTLAFRVTIDEGRADPVVGLALTGNAQTRASFVAREMLLESGRPWNRRALERGRERLLRTGLFRAVGEPYPLVDAAAAGLRVGLTVDEAPANRIEGVFGWNRGEGAEDGFFSGYLDFLFKNLGGVGRRAAARWERRGRDAREIRLGYREPWLPFVPAGAGVDLRRTFRDSTYVRTELEGAIDVPVGPALTLSASGAADSWSPGDRSPALVPKSRRVRGGFGFRLEGTDYPPNPSRGLNVALSGEYGEKTIDDGAAAAGSGGEAAAARVRYEEKIARASLDAFAPLGGPHVVALRARGELVSSDETPIPEYELFFIGGARTLRGYDEDRFLGEKVGVVTLEYRFVLAGRSRAFLFVDQGYYRLRRGRAEGAEMGLESIDGTPLGWGGGIQAESRLGIVGIGVGIPEGEGLDAARVHVSLEQDF